MSIFHTVISSHIRGLNGLILLNAQHQEKNSDVNELRKFTKTISLA